MADAGVVAAEGVGAEARSWRRPRWAMLAADGKKEHLGAVGGGRVAKHRWLPARPGSAGEGGRLEERSVVGSSFKGLRPAQVRRVASGPAASDGSALNCEPPLRGIRAIS